MKLRPTSNLFFLLIIWCCTPSDRNNFSSDPNTDIFPDSLFKYYNIQEVTESSLSNDFDTLSRIYTLIHLTRDQRQIYTDALFENGQHYNAAFYSKQHRLGRVQPILIYAYADHYNSVLLITVTNRDSVKGRLELTREICDVIEQHEENETVYCEKKHSTFKNDSTVLVSFVKETRTDSTGQVTSSIDSLTFVYKILASGSIELVQQDSVRYSHIER